MSTTAGLGVHGPGYNIARVRQLSELQLKNPLSSSFHDSHKESCYIFIGGLDYRLSEGDILIVFSQWGEPVDINLIRDRETGESKGFCFLGYEDQRSTVLAVDNANGMRLLERTLRVDHCTQYAAFVESGQEPMNLRDWEKKAAEQQTAGERQSQMKMEHASEVKREKQKDKSNEYPQVKKEVTGDGRPTTQLPGEPPRTRRRYELPSEAEVKSEEPKRSRRDEERSGERYGTRYDDRRWHDATREEDYSQRRYERGPRTTEEDRRASREDTQRHRPYYKEDRWRHHERYYEDRYGERRDDGWASPEDRRRMPLEDISERGRRGSESRPGYKTNRRGREEDRGQHEGYRWGKDVGLVDSKASEYEKTGWHKHHAERRRSRDFDEDFKRRRRDIEGPLEERTRRRGFTEAGRRRTSGDEISQERTLLQGRGEHDFSEAGEPLGKGARRNEGPLTPRENDAELAESGEERTAASPSTEDGAEDEYEDTPEKRRLWKEFKQLRRVYVELKLAAKQQGVHVKDVKSGRYNGHRHGGGNHHREDPMQGYENCGRPLEREYEVSCDIPPANTADLQSGDSDTEV